MMMVLLKVELGIDHFILPVPGNRAVCPWADFGSAEKTMGAHLMTTCDQALTWTLIEGDICLGENKNKTRIKPPSVKLR